MVEAKEMQTRRNPAKKEAVTSSDQNKSMRARRMIVKLHDEATSHRYAGRTQGQNGKNRQMQTTNHQTAMTHHTRTG